MMKRIYIVRHAKSSWKSMAIEDKDRPLNKRGLRDAPKMAKRLKELDFIPEVIVSSNAKRACRTASFFSQEFSIDFQLDSSLYHAPPENYFEVCYGLQESVKSVMLFGHNPGITYLAHEIASNNSSIDNVVTCGVLVIDSTATQWNEVDASNCELKMYLYPKQEL